MSWRKGCSIHTPPKAVSSSPARFIQAVLVAAGTAKANSKSPVLAAMTCSGHWLLMASARATIKLSANWYPYSFTTSFKDENRRTMIPTAPRPTKEANPGRATPTGSFPPSSPCFTAVLPLPSSLFWLRREVMSASCPKICNALSRQWIR